MSILSSPALPPFLACGPLSDDPADCVTETDVCQAYANLRWQNDHRERRVVDDVEGNGQSSVSPVVETEETAKNAASYFTTVAPSHAIVDHYTDEPITRWVDGAGPTITNDGQYARLSHATTPIVPSGIARSSTPAASKLETPKTATRALTAEATLADKTLRPVVEDGGNVISPTLSALTLRSLAMDKNGLFLENISWVEPHTIKLAAGLGTWAKETVAVGRLVDEDSQQMADGIAGAIQKERNVRVLLQRGMEKSVKIMQLNFMKDNNYLRAKRRKGLKKATRVAGRFMVRVRVRAWKR